MNGPNFDANGLIPVIAEDAHSGAVLLLALALIILGFVLGWLIFRLT
mgnify:CR=1 FL=1